MVRSKDIKKYLGITPGQLFHWGRTWGLINPSIKAEGRQGKDKYSFEDLLSLSLIKELLSFGIDLKTIKEILKGVNVLFKGKKTIWEEFKENRSIYEKKGCVLIIDREDVDLKKEKFIYFFTTADEALSQISEDIKFLYYGGTKAKKAILIINIYSIVGLLEEKTGDRL